jgi:predicted RNase H-like nuclease (RuvC/YqgF family)
MQAEAIKKRGQIITRYQGRVQELESDKSNLEEEIRKLKKNLHEKEEDY